MSLVGVPIAIEMNEYGPPDVLRAVDVPAGEPAADEVLVRNVIVGVNRADCFIRSGEWPQGGGFPYVPGLEACGVVERVGSSVTDLAVGDRVITMMQRLGGIHGTRRGGYQELVTVPARTLVRVPAELDLDLAGVLGLPAVTALLAIEALDVARGMRVLVQGGASAVGLIALQILRARGAHALATGTRPGKFALMRTCGAWETIDTRDPEWPAQIGNVDRVFDLVGRATFGESVNALAPGGRLVFVGGTSGGDLSFSGWALMRPVTLTGWSSEALDRPTLQRAVDALAALVSKGEVAAHAVTRFALADAASAHRALEEGSVAGRVVLVP